jgi:hypothetical protein
MGSAPSKCSCPLIRTIQSQDLESEPIQIVKWSERVYTDAPENLDESLTPGSIAIPSTKELPL